MAARPLNDPAAGFAALDAGNAIAAERMAREAFDVAGGIDESGGAATDWTVILALALAAQRRAGEALPHFEALVVLQPDVAAHWSNLGNALCEVGREKDALAPLQQAFQRGDRSAGTFFALARSELAHGRPLPAHVCIQRAVSEAPGDAEFRLFEARVLFALDETDRAMASLAELRDPALPMALRLEAAEIQLNLAQYAEAQAAFEALLREAPRNPGALMGLATCHERHNRLDDAEAARAAIDLGTVTGDAELESALAQLDARLAARRGDAGAARRGFEAVLRHPPFDPALRTQLRFELGKA